MNKFALLICFIPFCALSQSKAIHKDFLTPMDLNKNQNLYDGKSVTIVGFFINEVENSAIWQEKSDVEDTKVGADHCVSILYPKNMEKTLDKMTRHEVSITGVFDKDVSKSNRVYFGLCNWTGIRLTEIPKVLEI